MSEEKPPIPLRVIGEFGLTKDMGTQREVDAMYRSLLKQYGHIPEAVRLLNKIYYSKEPVVLKKEHKKSLDESRKIQEEIDKHLDLAEEYQSKGAYVKVLEELDKAVDAVKDKDEPIKKMMVQDAIRIFTDDMRKKGVDLKKILKQYKESQTRSFHTILIKSISDHSKQEIIDIIWRVEHELENINSRNKPNLYADTLNELGELYFTLSILEKNKNNLKKAIKLFKDGLKIKDLGAFGYPRDIFRFNIGTSLIELSKFENIKKNLLKSISIFKKIDQNINAKKNPLEYAFTKLKMGDAYSALSNIKNQEKNLTLALNSYKEAESYFSNKTFPYFYNLLLENIQNIKGGLAILADLETLKSGLMKK